MTQAQELYNQYIVCKVVCPQCRKTVSFQSITDWGYELSDFKCPYCKVLVNITDAEVLDKTRRMAYMDKAIVNKLLEHAKQGQLHSHEIADTTQWACLCLVSKMANLKSEPVPLSYIYRMFLIQLYRQLVEDSKVDEIDIYAIQAPIPVEVVVPRVGTLTHQIRTAKSKKKKKKKKVKTPAAEVSFGFGAPEVTQAEKDKMNMFDDILGISKKEDKDG